MATIAGHAEIIRKAIIEQHAAIYARREPKGGVSLMNLDSILLAGQEE